MAVSSGIVHASANDAENALAARLPTKLLRCPELGGGGDILPVICRVMSRLT